MMKIDQLKRDNSSDLNGLIMNFGMNDIRKGKDYGRLYLVFDFWQDLLIT